MRRHRPKSAAAVKQEIQDAITAIKAVHAKGKEIGDDGERADYRHALRDADAHERWKVSAARAVLFRKFASKTQGYTREELNDFFVRCRQAGYVPRLAILLRLLPLGRPERRAIENKAIEENLSAEDVSRLLSSRLPPSAASHRRKGRKRAAPTGPQELELCLAQIDSEALGLLNLLQLIVEPERRKPVGPRWPLPVRRVKANVISAIEKLRHAVGQAIEHKREVRSRNRTEQDASLEVQNRN